MALPRRLREVGDEAGRARKSGGIGRLKRSVECCLITRNELEVKDQVPELDLRRLEVVLS